MPGSLSWATSAALYGSREGETNRMKMWILSDFSKHTLDLQYVDFADFIGAKACKSQQHHGIYGGIKQKFRSLRSWVNHKRWIFWDLSIVDGGFWNKLVLRIWAAFARQIRVSHEVETMDFPNWGKHHFIYSQNPAVSSQMVGSCPHKQVKCWEYTVVRTWTNHLHQGNVENILVGGLKP